LVNGVVDSITSKEVEFNNKGRSFRSVNLDELLPLSPELVPTGADELGGAVRDLLALQADTRQDVTLQNLLQLLLVAHQLVEGVHRDLVEGSVSRSEDGEGSGPGEVLHHAGGLQGGVEGGEVLVLGDHGSNALPGLVDGHRGLGGGAGDGVDVRSAEVVRLGTRRTDGEVVVKSSHQPGLVGASLASQERVESLDRAALERERSPLDWSGSSQRFTLDRDRARDVVSSVGDWLVAGLHRGGLGVGSMLSMLSMLSVVGSVCGMLSMMSAMSGLGSMFGMLLAVLGMMSMVARAVVAVFQISHDKRNHH